VHKLFTACIRHISDRDYKQADTDVKVLKKAVCFETRGFSSVNKLSMIAHRCKNVLRFFILVTFFTFLVFFYFVNFFIF